MSELSGNEKKLVKKIEEINALCCKEHQEHDRLRQIIFAWLCYAYAELDECDKNRFMADSFKDVENHYIAEGKLTEMLAAVASANLEDLFLSWLEIGKNVPNKTYKYRKEIQKVLLVLKERKGEQANET